MHTLTKIGGYTVATSLLGGIGAYIARPYVGEIGQIQELMDLATASPWTPALIGGLMAISGLVAIPASISSILGGFLYGYWAYSFLMPGVFFGILVGYAIGYKVPVETENSHIHPKLRNLLERAQQHPTAASFAIRFFPGFPFAVQSLVMGSLKVPLPHYCLGSMMGIFTTNAMWIAIGMTGSIALERAADIVHSALPLSGFGISIGVAMMVVGYRQQVRG